MACAGTPLDCLSSQSLASKVEATLDTFGFIAQRITRLARSRWWLVKTHNAFKQLELSPRLTKDMYMKESKNCCGSAMNTCTHNYSYADLFFYFFLHKFYSTSNS